MSNGGMYEPWTITTSFKFSGDTTIQQKTYYKLLRSEDEMKINWALHSLWFEKNDSVFLKYLTEDYDRLIYDFTISEKDSFTVEENELYLYVDSIRLQVWGGKEREFFYFHPSEIYSGYGYTVWIKGVGQTGLLTRSTEIDIFGANCSLLCFEEDGELVYQNPEYNSCSVFTSVTNLKKEPELVEVFSIGENFLIINSLNANAGFFQVYDILGIQIVQKEIESRETQIGLPTTGTYIYRFISNTGKIQSGKVVVR
ncbi:MAG: T9SS type A sorting domain-containing protein [Prolixibacteraceae bacterium]|nr:T9SS type A sorting domain-containing protein [Prolixibacteraceae bacterium]